MAKHLNTQTQLTTSAPIVRKRPLLTENQLVGLVLVGGGAALVAAGLLLVFAVGGGAAVAAGILLGLLGLGLVLGYFYLRALGKAYQH